MKNRHLLHRFGFALDGLRYAWQSERSIRTEGACAVAAILALVILQPGWTWAAVIIVCIMLVIALELVNSALEALLDHLHPEIAPAIKHAKDAAAAAVLVASTGSVCIAAMMLLSVLQG